MSQFLHLWNENSAYLAELLWALNEQEPVKYLEQCFAQVCAQEVLLLFYKEH